MVTFCYYISDYGSGHATRSIALIRALVELVPDVYIIVKSEGPYQLLTRSLRHPRITVLNCRNDIELILNPDTPVINKEQTFRILVSWLDLWDTYLRSEIHFCRDNQVDVIISDIASQPFLVAEELGIPGIAVSNFSWDTILIHLFPGYSQIDRLRSAYRAATDAMVLPFHTDMSQFSKRQEVGLLARKQTISRSRMRTLAGIPDSTILVYLGAGRTLPLLYAKSLISGVQNGVRFLVPSGTLPPSSSIISIPQNETESQNWIGMCDLVITKCGYSTVSEAVQAQVPLLVSKREGFIEDEVIAGIIEEECLGAAISIQEIQDGIVSHHFDAIRRRTENYDTYDNRYTNDTDSIAQGIMGVIA